MKLVSINSKYWSACKELDFEVLSKSKRPYVLILKLKYNGKNQNFAIPLRSNINKSEQKSMYFSLPPNKTTKKGNKHGLHFRKMIPINKKLYEKYNIYENNSFDILIQNKIEKDFSKIVSQAQVYLDFYAENQPVMYATNLDELLKLLETEFLY